MSRNAEGRHFPVSPSSSKSSSKDSESPTGRRQTSARFIPRQTGDEAGGRLAVPLLALARYRRLRTSGLSMVLDIHTLPCLKLDFRLARPVQQGTLVQSGNKQTAGSSPARPTASWSNGRWSEHACLHSHSWRSASTSARVSATQACSSLNFRVLVFAMRPFPDSSASIAVI
jgi:hypothetical protein